MTYRIEIYNSHNKSNWDNLVTNSKNGTFLFYRNYMEYHSDRFQDFSLMFYEDKNLIAILPANISDNILYSHQGLSYGGMIFGSSMKAVKMLNIFTTMQEFLKSKKIKKLIYKAIPHIFHSSPAEEDLYALFRNNAKLYRRDLSSTILQTESIVNFERGRKRCVEEAKRNGLKIRETDDFDKMYNLIKDILQTKYNSKPVHSADEMRLLKSRFPENIKLFGSYQDNEMLSGALIYITKNVAHAQYVYSSDLGKRIGANDLMYDHLINHEFRHKKYFNFGISTEKNGLYLNENLLQQKEMLTARTICYDFYELDIV